MSEKKKDELQVGCAVIEHQGRLLIAQRKHGDSYGGYWEFPGGTLEKGETIEDCLRREVFEELGIVIRPRRLIEVTPVEKPKVVLFLHFYLCGWVSGSPTKKDCLDFQWVLPEELGSFLFLPSDLAMIQELNRRKAYYFDPLRF